MAKSYNQVVLFGDSLFEGAADVKDGFCFQSALQVQCNRRLDVVNRGFSGYNTVNALDLLPQIFLPPSEATPKIDYLLVLLGANDACIPLPTDTQGVPLSDYKSNLHKIITHPYITAHKPKILLITPPPLDEIKVTEADLAWGHSQATRQAAVSASYSEAARQAAAEVPGTVLVDLQKALMEEAIRRTPAYDASKGLPLGYPGGIRGALETLLPDGLHMSGDAYRVLYDLVQPHVGPFDYDNPDQEYVFPTWAQLNSGGI
ncbi:SGNH hydrolase-type esterase domain-containing protein [Pseudomassariella vexata]|uniref:SGNH hydrolase-type esterase domain-containing protein n=1 Tax=Pseudomassariella vexata TaxID=1141098 RepID=A0A1Y2DIM9_9PEZI|nr:SGNH hydrolase-type esterase domain-containing protein [Pseudomassariella vexata]ORY59083.1 SGNH hydrolase-type esterase domain-containing protein [Pseudomassariella vexata]